MVQRSTRPSRRKPAKKAIVEEAKRRRGMSDERIKAKNASRALYEEDLKSQQTLDRFMARPGGVLDKG